MRVFITGGSGFVGSAVVAQLLAAGHQVVGLARSESSASALERAGTRVHRGDIEDHESLRAGADSADAVIHLAFTHDFADFARAADSDRGAIEAMGEVLAGSDRPFVATSGLAGFSLGRDLTETTSRHPTRRASRSRRRCNSPTVVCASRWFDCRRRSTARAITALFLD